MTVTSVKQPELNGLQMSSVYYYKQGCKRDLRVQDETFPHNSTRGDRDVRFLSETLLACAIMASS